MLALNKASVNLIKFGQCWAELGTAEPSPIFMVAIWNRADHYIFILSIVLSSSFFPRLISAATDWMSAILPHMVWP